jgi:pyruvate dehydrogenase kinase 2/3/4
MVLFGKNPCQGTLVKASQFLAGARFTSPSHHSAHTTLFRDSEELPVRLAHRVKELDELPHDLSRMPSIKKVKNWYAQSFEVCQFHTRYSPTSTHP